jgi:hypothetical protein
VTVIVVQPRRQRPNKEGTVPVAILQAPPATDVWE